MRKVILFVLLYLAGISTSYAGNEWQVNRILHDESHIYVAVSGFGLFIYDKTTGMFQEKSIGRGQSDISLHEGKIYGINKDGILMILDGEEYKEINLNAYGRRRGKKNPPCMAWGADGTLWLGLGTELGQYRNGTYFVSEFITQGLSEEQVNDLCVDKDGTLWIAAWAMRAQKSYACFSEEKGLSFLSKDQPTNFSSSVYAVKTDAKGTKWFASSTGLVCYDESGVLTRIDMPKEYTGGMNDLYVLPDDGILCAVGNYLLYYHDGQYRELCQVSGSSQITRIDADGDSYYIGTTNGLFKYESGQISRIDLPGQERTDE